MNKRTANPHICQFCGNEFYPFETSLAKGKGKFCSPRCSSSQHMTQHGHASSRKHSRTYSTWAGMFSRCYNAHNRKYANYGGRGITVCERWKSNFAAFLEDMGERPEGRTLDRIDNEKGYAKENCRWATPLEQAHNMRTNRSIEYQGMTLNLGQLTSLLGVNRNTLYYRIKRGAPESEWAKPALYSRKKPA